MVPQFITLEESRTRNWEEIFTKFTKQFQYNTKVNITKQESKETFSLHPQVDGQMKGPMKKDRFRWK